jgi:hypothetical protein
MLVASASRKKILSRLPASIGTKTPISSSQFLVYTESAHASSIFLLFLVACICSLGITTGICFYMFPSNIPWNLFITWNFLPWNLPSNAFFRASFVRVRFAKANNPGSSENPASHHGKHSVLFLLLLSGKNCNNLGMVLTATGLNITIRVLKHNQWELSQGASRSYAHKNLLISLCAIDGQFVGFVWMSYEILWVRSVQSIAGSLDRDCMEQLSYFS